MEKMHTLLFNEAGKEAQAYIHLLADTAKMGKIKLPQAEKKYAQSIWADEADAAVHWHFGGKHIWAKPFARKSGSAGSEKARRWGAVLAGTMDRLKIKSAVITSSPGLPALEVAEGILLAGYRFNKYFKDADKRAFPLQELTIEGATADQLLKLQSTIEAVYIARDLINEPVNALNAEALANKAVELGEEFGFSVEVLNKKKIESLKMGGLLAVNKGSLDAPTFTILEYKGEGAAAEKPTVLVGKGVVYDTGGLSLKPTAGSMDSMKSDMSGAAAVIGTFVAAASLNLPVHLVGLIPATDNRPGGNAYTPGDIIYMMNGSTVEVLNTDAEGRMILADALHYAKRYQPEVVINLATLTGAAAVAIGIHGIVAMGNAAEPTWKQLNEAGEKVYERLVRFPFWEEYLEQMKSSVADLKNIGGREGGAITAGKFLETFTDYPFVHLDIAGPAFMDSATHYRPKGGTGVGVRLLTEFLINQKG